MLCKQKTLISPRYRIIVSVACVLFVAACGGGGESNPSSLHATDQTGRALVAVSTEPAGVNCVTGGSRVNAGLDSNADGVLTAAETQTVQYVCNGIAGTPGIPGASGAAGSAGARGLAGSSGVAGWSTLVHVSVEPASTNCTRGGSRIEAGFDVNGNRVLDAAEVESTGFVCAAADGMPGTGGTNGTNGASSLFAIVVESAGVHCAYGGSRISSGLDLNADSALDAGEVTSTTYICNGPPGPGLTWVDVTSSSVQAQSNTGYLADTAVEVTVTLPAAPALGDLVRVSGIGSGGWQVAQNAGQSVFTGSTAWHGHDQVRAWRGVASSADGTRLVASVRFGQLYTSVDSGMSWTPRAAVKDWTGVASSADGMHLVALAYDDDIYTSADAGVTWVPSGIRRYWISAASSADGSKLVAGAAYPAGQLYTSTDFGVTWTPRETNRQWITVASSADGSKLVAAAQGGSDFLYTSTDSGVTWTPRESARDWYGVASSADGTRLLASAINGSLYTSADAGVTWVPRAGPRFWKFVASSSDGRRLLATSNDGPLFVSSDLGVTWAARETSRSWNYAAMSADGRKLFATTDGDQIFNAGIAVRTTPGISGSIRGAQGESIELQYTGGGLFTTLSSSGDLQVQ